MSVKALSPWNKNEPDPRQPTSYTPDKHLPDFSKMNSRRISKTISSSLCTLLLPLAAVIVLQAAPPFGMLDDYSDPVLNRKGVKRLLIDDKTAGSMSKATLKVENGLLSVKGELVPGRGVPAFISQVSLLTTNGSPVDLTGHQGVRLKVKVTRGILVVQVASSEITNFDFHSGAPLSGKPGEFQEIRVPFKDMKRAWSEQTTLNLKTITSVNLVSFGLARDTFAYEVDEIGFY